MNGVNIYGYDDGSIKAFIKKMVGTASTKELLVKLGGGVVVIVGSVVAYNMLGRDNKDGLINNIKKGVQDALSETDATNVVTGVGIGGIGVAAKTIDDNVTWLDKKTIQNKYKIYSGATPVKGGLYIEHPKIPDLLIPINEYVNVIESEKVNEISNYLACFGDFTEINVQSIQKNKLEGSISGKILAAIAEVKDDIKEGIKKGIADSVTDGVKDGIVNGIKDGIKETIKGKDESSGENEKKSNYEKLEKLDVELGIGSEDKVLAEIHPSTDEINKEVKRNNYLWVRKDSVFNVIVNACYRKDKSVDFKINNSFDVGLGEVAEKLLGINFKSEYVIHVKASRVVVSKKNNETEVIDVEATEVKPKKLLEDEGGKKFKGTRSKRVGGWSRTRR